MSWQKRFDKEFVKKGNLRVRDLNNEPYVIGTARDIKRFISQVLEEERNDRDKANNNKK